MVKYRTKFNPLSGKFDLISDETSFHIKDPVNTYADLPISGNNENDMRFVKDTDDAYVWTISSSSGNLSDWKKIPLLSNLVLDDIVDGITYKKISEIEKNKIHEHLNKTLLDSYTQLELDLDDAVDKKHEHPNKFEIDKVTIGDHDVLQNNPHNVTAEQVGAGITYIESELETITTDAVNWQQKIRLSFSPPEIGDYWLHWSAEVANSGANKGTEVQVELDDTTQLNYSVNAPIVANGYANIDGFKKINFADINQHTIDIDFKVEGTGTAKIRRARLAIRKM